AAGGVHPQEYCLDSRIIGIHLELFVDRPGIEDDSLEIDYGNAVPGQTPEPAFARKQQRRKQNDRDEENKTKTSDDQNGCQIEFLHLSAVINSNATRSLAGWITTRVSGSRNYRSVIAAKLIL